MLTETNSYFFLSSAFVADRADGIGNKHLEGSELPEFTDVKIFIDSLLISYQSNRPMEYELERTALTCTPFRRDFLNGKFN
jgi:hypothetical protein